MTQLSELNRISIAELVIYLPALGVAIILALRHGFGRNAGWLYLILFSLVRILGAALELASMNDPTNTGLIVGGATLQSIGLSPLLLTMLGLLGRVLQSVNSNTNTILQPRMLRIVQILVLVGLILGIVGGSDTGSNISDAQSKGVPFVYTVPAESLASVGLFIAGFVLLVLATVLLAIQIRHAEAGEKRLLLAVALALPFVLVRLIFAAFATFDSDNLNFRQFGGSSQYPDYLLGMAVVMEMVAVAIFETVGLLLRQIPKGERKPVGDSVPMGRFGGGRFGGGRLVGGRRDRHHHRHHRDQREYQQDQGVGRV